MLTECHLPCLYACVREKAWKRDCDVRMVVRPDSAKRLARRSRIMSGQLNWRNTVPAVPRVRVCTPLLPYHSNHSHLSRELSNSGFLSTSCPNSGITSIDCQNSCFVHRHLPRPDFSVGLPNLSSICMNEFSVLPKSEIFGMVYPI